MAGLDSQVSTESSTPGWLGVRGRSPTDRRLGRLLLPVRPVLWWRRRSPSANARVTRSASHRHESEPVAHHGLTWGRMVPVEISGQPNPLGSRNKASASLSEWGLLKPGPILLSGTVPGMVPEEISGQPWLKALKQTGAVLPGAESYEGQEEGDSMASTAKLWPSEPGQFRSDLRGSVALSLVSGEVVDPVGGQAVGSAGSGGDEALGGHLSVAHEALWMAAEPARGEMVRARHANHHTSSLVFTRDDREGHPPRFGDEQARTWWSHDMQKWMSWQQIGGYLSEHRDNFVVEVLIRRFRTGEHAFCEPDGACLLEEPGDEAWR